MDWNAAIERNREALKRILASLVAMAGLADSAGTLPRHLRLAVLRLLRPAEAATRRLVIVMARGLPAPPARRSRPRKAGAMATILRNGVGTGIVLPRGAPVQPIPPRAVRRLAFPLLDPLRPWNRRRRPVATSVPRICLPGHTEPFPVAPRRPPSPNDSVDAARLGRRLAALASALDDLPGQARRFARWRGRRRTGPFHRIQPMRPGRPPGARARPVHEVHDVLNVVHRLAFWAMESSDTS